MKGDRSVYVEFNVVSFTYDNGTQFLFQPYSESMEGTTEVLYTTGKRAPGSIRGRAITTIGTTTFLRSAPPGARHGSRIINPFWGYDEQYVTKVR